MSELPQIATHRTSCVDASPPCLHTACTDWALRELVGKLPLLTPSVRSANLELARRGSQRHPIPKSIEVSNSVGLRAVRASVSSDRRDQGAPIRQQEVVSSGRPAIDDTRGDGNSDRVSSGGSGLREGSGRRGQTVELQLCVLLTPAMVCSHRAGCKPPARSRADDRNFRQAAPPEHQLRV